jgi:hypothetical protein
MAEIKIAFWNLQNLFDTVPSDIAADLGFTPEQGWTQAVFQQKITNLAAAIRLMFAGEMPDLLGICEIETKALAEQLINLIDPAGLKQYRVAHVDSPDIRGIDTSLIYSANVFEPAGQPVGHLIFLRYPTRDIFQVPLRVLANGAELMVLVNHWPSRRQGQYETEPFRLTVANHCGRLVDDVLKVSRAEFLLLPDAVDSLTALNRRWNRNVLLMGDFNDEPFTRSMLSYLQASSGTDKLEEPIRKAGGSNLPDAESYLRRQAFLYNCMWPVLGRPDEGTYYYSDSTNTMNLLDQFIISRGLYYGSAGLRFDLPSVEVFRPELIRTGGKGRPKAFSFTTTGQVLVSGYSDHFPILSRLEVL